MFLLIGGLARRGHGNLLFCRSHSRVSEEARRRRVSVQEVRMRNDLDAPAVVALARGFRRQRIDLVHLHTGRATWLGGLAARLVGLPAISTRRMDRRVKRNWRTRLTFGALVQRVVAISPGVAACLADGGVRRERVEVIYSAVDPALLRAVKGRSGTRTALGAGSDDSVLLVLAALVQRKGHDVLLDALALIAPDFPRAILWIAGEGPQRALVEEQARRHGLSDRVRLLGRREDVADLLAACDVLVLPSRREGLGIAALEAMAAGRPVVGSAVGGLQHAVVHERTGLLVPPEDSPMLAAALRRVLCDDDLRQRLGAAGPGRVAEGFLAEQMVASYDELYRTVLAEWHRSAKPPNERALALA